MDIIECLTNGIKKKVGDLQHLVGSPSGDGTHDGIEEHEQPEELHMLPPIEHCQQVIGSMIDKKGLSITITFRESLLLKYKKRYIRVMIEEIMKHTKGIREYMLIPDYSSSGRFHYHGVILFNEVKNVMTLKRKLSREIGRTDISQIRRGLSYGPYCFKLYNVEKETFEHNLVISKP